MAFGTGTHPTTILSIQGLESIVQNNDIILDVGSGSGILSIASILLGARTVFAYDLDEIAVKSTIADRKSTRLNSSHVAISYAVFCLKKKKKIKSQTLMTMSEKS